MLEQAFLFFYEFDFVFSNITTIVMILTFASLFLANLARFVQAKNYGIPLKMVNYAGIPDSMEIWITLLSIFGFGLVLPWVMLSAPVYSVIVFPVVFASCWVGVASTGARVTTNNVNGEDGTVTTINNSWKFFLVIGLLNAIAFTYLHYVSQSAAEAGILQSTFTVLARVKQGMLIFYIAAGTIRVMYRKVVGNQDLMTVEIDGQLYLIAMKHVLNFWVLLPCTMEKVVGKGITISHSKKKLTEEEKKEAKLKNKELNMVDAIKFTRGKFIVRDISLLESTKNIHCRKQLSLVGVSE